MSIGRARVYCACVSNSASRRADVAQPSTGLAAEGGRPARAGTRDATVGSAITNDTGPGTRTDAVTAAEGEGWRGHQRICLARRSPSDLASHVAANGARHACSRGGGSRSGSSPAALPADRVGVPAPHGVLLQGLVHRRSLHLSRRRIALRREMLSQWRCLLQRARVQLHPPGDDLRAVGWGFPPTGAYSAAQCMIQPAETLMACPVMPRPSCEVR